MSGRRRAFLLGLAAPLAVAAALAAQQQPAFRAGVEIVSLTVTVTDAEGRYVTGLADGEFEVYEDGVRQDVAYFNRTNLPIALSLLLDTSSSMEGRIGTAQEAAAGFARRLRPEDLGGLVDFDTRVVVAQQFTSDAARLEEAIRRTTAGGSTSLYNAIYVALKELRKVRARSEQELRRQAVVVLSDGEDTSSLVSYEEVLDLAKRSDTSIYTIGLRDPEEPATKGFNEAEFVLRDLAQQTGGRSFFPERIDDLAAVYDRIAEELASQYVLGYVSKNSKRDGAWRRVVVRVARPDLRARTKQGYFAPTPR
ncbi:MAG TPA: VWA domain-containing protein [Vicinamibacterales bacterium]|nr:VWA domain-containing protein [Acidobacteriota bacterium]HOC17813.1 VWA domain-containing protein [Vicinamibacterales bacterium]